MAVRIFLAVMIAFAAACERKPPPPAKPVSAGSVKIVGLSPDTTTALKVGAKVKVQAEVTYRLVSEAGALTLVVQADKTGVAQVSQPVKQGEGKATLAVEFVVPDTKALQVYTPLQALGQKTTATLDHRTYKVVPAK